MRDPGRTRGRAWKLVVIAFFPVWAFILSTLTWTLAGQQFVLGLPGGVVLAVMMYVPLAFVGWRRASAVHQLETELERRGMTLLEVHNTWPDSKIRFLAVDHDREIDVTGDVLLDNPRYLQFAPPQLEGEDKDKP